MNRKIIAVAAAVAILFWTGPSFSQTEDPMTGFFQQSFGDLTEELAVASEEGLKGVFIMFDDKDCPWCAKMKTTILNQKVVQDYYRSKFRIIRVDSNGDGLMVDFNGNEITEKALADKSRVRATPVMIFFDLLGKPMQRYTGAARDVQEFLWLGEYVADEHYKTEKYAVYKRNKKKQGM